MTENTSGADTSYEQALKSTGIVGGAQFLTILITVVKTKIVALLLGPAGVGVLGLLQGIVDMIRNATGLGIHFSAVKDVAAANASRDGQRIGRTIRILRRWVWGTGLLGMTVAIALSIPLSRFSFGNAEYAVPIVLVSVVLLLTSLQEGQLALLQGLRMIGKMAKAKVAGAVAGFALTVPMYWWLGVKGIVPAMILTAAAMLAILWWFVRGIRVEPVKLTPKETFRGGLSIAKLGFFIVVTTFASTATMYIVRSFVSQKIGTDGVGMFQAAWNISNVYTGLITSAMMADFFPRLSERSNDHAAMARLTNEQGEIALIIGAPMIAGILLFIPVVLNILYSSQFMAATAILQWQMAGAFTGFLSWPLSVIFLAKGKGHYCILTDGVWCAAYLSIVFAGWHRFGLEILGIAAICSSFAKLVLVYVLVRTQFRFRWSRRNLRLIGLYGGLIAGALLTVLLASGWVKYAIGGAIVLIVCCISYRHLNEIVAVSSLITKIRRRMGGKRP